MSSTNDTAIVAAKLLEMKNRAYIPARLLSLISSTVAAQQEMSSKITVRPLKISTTVEQHFNGAPLALRADFTWNKKTAEQLFKKILKKLSLPEQEKTDAISMAALHITNLLSQKELDIQMALKAAVAEDNNFFKPFAKKMPQAPDLLSYICLNTLAPFIEKHAAVLGKKHEDKVWLHGHCPICGSLPFMGNLTGQEGARYHACSFCRTSYRVPRLQCAFCLHEQPDGTSVYKAEEDKFFLIYPCNKCKSYMKIADFRELERQYVPAFDDLISLPFDMKAREMGFSRPAKSAWGV